MNIATMPSAYLAFERQMQTLQTQVAQQVAQMAQVSKSLTNAGQALRQRVAEISRAQVFLVEQYEKTPRAKQKKAHAHLVRMVCGALAKLRSAHSAALQSLLAKAARKGHTQDTRIALRASLSEQHLANAPNLAQRFVTPNNTEVAATN